MFSHLSYALPTQMDSYTVFQVAVSYGSETLGNRPRLRESYRQCYLIKLSSTASSPPLPHTHTTLFTTITGEPCKINASTRNVKDHNYFVQSVGILSSNAKSVCLSFSIIQSFAALHPRYLQTGQGYPHQKCPLPSTYHTSLRIVRGETSPHQNLC